MNWKHVSLGEISVNIQTGPFGSQLHQSDYSEKGTPVVMPKDLISGHISEESIARVSDDHVERLSRHKIEVGDILYSRRGDVGRCAFASETEAGWLCGTGCLRVTIDSRKAYVLVWKTFLINQIITRASAGEYRVFNETSTDYKLIVSLLKCIYGESKTSSVVMPKIKKGSIELTAAFAENLSASLKLELEFDSQKKRINYTKLSKKVYQIFSQLEFVHSPVYVLIDELELSVRNKYQFEKDVALVRDLIIAMWI